MPIYDYQCPKCFTMYKDIKVKLEEKDTFSRDCENCENVKLVQRVAPLRFKLEGQGWFENSNEPYAITQTELNNNLDFEKRKEDEIFTMQENDLKIKEL
jgi:predicted nucleic acid-binding Zn ribbon protein